MKFGLIFFLFIAQVALSKDQLCCDEQLPVGGKIDSPNRLYFLTFQKDGNLVLYKNDGKPLWASNTGGRPATRCVMQVDGNLVIYNGPKAIWASNTNGNRNARLVIQDDGNVVIYKAGNVPVWASNTVQPVAVRPANERCCEELLAIDQRIESPNRQHFLIFQADGNLVLYTQQGTPRWASNTGGRPATRCVMQGDGNLVIYNGATAIWSSNTYGNKGANLVVQDDGNVVINQAAGVMLWETKTVMKTPMRKHHERCCDQELTIDKHIDSGNHNFFVVFQADGNLVLYKGDGSPIWASNTGGIPATRCVMQADGNLVIYNGNTATWASNTNGNSNAALVMQDDGNLVIYKADGTPIWASNTGGR